MAIEECPHCICKVMFSDDGKCPACKKSKFIRSSKSRDQIIYEIEKKDTIEKIKILNKRGINLIISGTLLTVVVVTIIIFMMFNATIVVYWYGGVIGGLSMIGKGWIDLRDKGELIYYFNKKYGEKLPSR